MPDIDAAFRDSNCVLALHAYSNLRQAMVAPDDMSEEGLKALMRRVLRAADTYPSNNPVQAAMNKALVAYAHYLSQVMWEQAYDQHYKED